MNYKFMAIFDQALPKIIESTLQGCVHYFWAYYNV